MRYRTLLLDADGTLFDFEKAQAKALESALGSHGLPFNDEILSLYSRINTECWEAYEQGRMEKDVLLVERFRRLFAALHTAADPVAVRLSYHNELGKGAYLIDGAYELCRELKTTHALYIITNGVAQTQHSRFCASGLAQMTDGIFISEEIGYPKPQKEYFDYVSAHIPGFEKSRALIVGDSLTADMQGGLLAGIDTCWFNPKKKKKPANLPVTYEIHRLPELLKIARSH